MIGLDADALRPNSNASSIDGAAISQRRLMAHPHHQTQVLQELLLIFLLVATRQFLLQSFPALQLPHYPRHR